MKRKNINKLLQSVSVIKLKARELMLSGENHITLILAIIVATVTAVAPIMILNMIYMWISQGVMDTLLFAFWAFITAPICMGILRLACLMAKRQSTSLTELFYGFSSFRTYVKYLGIAIVSLLVFLLPVVPIILAALLRVILAKLVSVEWILNATEWATFIISELLAIWLSCRLSFYSALAVSGNRVFRPLRQSFWRTRKKTRKTLRLWLSFLPLAFVSIIAILVPMVIYTLPYMLCAYALCALDIIENNQ